MGNGAREAAMGGVIAGQMGYRIGVCNLVDGNDVQRPGRLLLAPGAQHGAANSAKAIDGNALRHTRWIGGEATSVKKYIFQRGYHILHGETEMGH